MRAVVEDPSTTSSERLPELSTCPVLPELPLATSTGNGRFRSARWRKWTPASADSPSPSTHPDCDDIQNGPGPDRRCEATDRRGDTRAGARHAGAQRGRRLSRCERAERME